MQQTIARNKIYDQIEQNRTHRNAHHLNKGLMTMMLRDELSAPPLCKPQSADGNGYIRSALIGVFVATPIICGSLWCAFTLGHALGLL